MYEAVLREGDGADIERYVDGALLVDQWMDLVLPADLRAAWAPLIEPLLAASWDAIVRCSGRSSSRSRLFFSLPAAQVFLLAGGAALLAQGMTHRPTQDLDFFTARGVGEVARAEDEFSAAARERGWTVERLQASGELCRLLIPVQEDDLLVDLALESKPGMPARTSVAGPTFAP